MAESSPPRRSSTRRVLVGVDGSPASFDALSFAAPLAAGAGAELLVVWVQETAPTDPAGSQAQVEEWCATRGVTADQVLVLDGPAGPTLAEAAATQDADLVIVGTEGLGQRLREGIGSVANLLAHRLRVPFLAIPVGCRWRGLHEIVVAVDGSESALAAVDLLTDFPGVTEATVHAVYACQPLTETVGQPLSEAARQQATHDLDSWTVPLAERTAGIRRLLRDEARPADTVISTADEVHADLVVMGAQATNQLTKQRAGSTVFQVLHAATRPTMLVPPPDQACRATLVT